MKSSSAVVIGDEVVRKRVECRESFQREKNALSALHGGPVPKIFRTSGKEFFLERIPGFTLDQVEETYFPQSCSGSIQHIPEKLEILRCLARQLTFVHAHGCWERASRGVEAFAHYDLKEGNVIVGDLGQKTGASSERNWRVSIIDFGTSFPCQSIPQRFEQDNIGTIPRMSPEHFRKQPVHGCKADIFAFGLMAYVLLTGIEPSAGLPPRAWQQQVLAGEAVDSSLIISPEIDNLVRRCLEMNPNERWTARELEVYLSSTLDSSHERFF